MITVLIDVICVLALVAWLLCGAAAIVFTGLIALAAGRTLVQAAYRVTAASHRHRPIAASIAEMDSEFLRGVGVKR